ncbi:alanine racemase [Natronorubrum halophilum]|uniref:alanine racemase n=1 Tax=Natronorubrum halophilum TaxID=1702106 RepID=UPI0010C1FF2E|nr:alanine racemase [Natronorubrum halophilum]
MPTPTLTDSTPRLDQSRDDLETPAVVVDLDTMEANMREFAEFAQRHDVALRSHVKTHKIPDIAHRQEELSGGDGILCQTLSEAEVMAQNGISDIYLSYMVVEESKLDRLVRLSERLESFATTVDCPGNIDPLQAAADRHGATVDAVLEIDVGLGRTGVPPGEPALEMAARIVDAENLSFAGLMGFEGHVNGEAESEADYERLCEAAMDELQGTAELLESDGVPVDDVRVGSTGTARHSGKHPVVTEINPGMYPFNDANVVSWAGPIGPADCALTVLTTVISKPADDRVIVDAGSKTMSFDVDRQPIPNERDDIEYVTASEEHGWIDSSDADEPIEVGDRLEFIVPHVCTTVNLHDTLIGTRDGRVEEVWNVQARGKEK